jgi:hypothetical protein
VIVAADPPSGPVTPVPPVPTREQLYRAAIEIILSLNDQIRTTEVDIHLYEYLLERQPTNQAIRNYLTTLRMRLVELKNRRAWWQAYAAGLL